MSITVSSLPPVEVENPALPRSPPPHSPARFSPASSLPAIDVPTDDDFDLSIPPYEEVLSSAAFDDAPVLRDEQEVGLGEHGRYVSSGSSISSFPASVTQRLPSTPDRLAGPRTSAMRESHGSHYYSRSGSARPHVALARELGQYPSPFRHTSSVRAMQQRDDAMSDAQSVVRHHRRTGSQVSAYSHKSVHSARSSPSKRGPRTSTQHARDGVRKEYPLVLLHCTVLSPRLLSRPTADDDATLAELLPPPYRERWTLLRDKMLGDAEVEARGVLIPHPREDYGLLEERLLESLDLELPRIRHNHFFQSDAASGDSGFESGGHSEDERPGEAPGDAACPDCGRRLREPAASSLKWEIKVFAANGLMRAGAWAAAWQEMEKVDVEVRMWLPDDVRRDLEAKAATLCPPDADEIEPLETGGAPDVPFSREREIYGDAAGNDYQAASPDLHSMPREDALPTPPFDLPIWLRSGARHFGNDWRNLMVGLLSLLVLLLALGGRDSPVKANNALPVPSPSSVTEVLTTTITATSQLASQVTDTNPTTIPTTTPTTPTIATTGAPTGPESLACASAEPPGALTAMKSEHTVACILKIESTLADETMATATSAPDTVDLDRQLHGLPEVDV